MRQMSADAAVAIARQPHVCQPRRIGELDRRHRRPWPGGVPGLQGDAEDHAVVEQGAGQACIACRIGGVAAQRHVQGDATRAGHLQLLEQAGETGVAPRLGTGQPHHRHRWWIGRCSPGSQLRVQRVVERDGHAQHAGHGRKHTGGERKRAAAATASPTRSSGHDTPRALAPCAPSIGTVVYL